MTNPHPKYKVSWKQNECGPCRACNHKNTHTYTFSFFNPEPALALAIDIVKKGHTLLFVEQ